VKLHEVLYTQYDVTWVAARGDRWYLSAPKMGEHGYWEGGSILWASDGTPGGTVAVASIPDVYEASRFESMLVALDGRVFFPGCAGADCGVLATAGRTAEVVRHVTVEPESLLSDVVGRAGRHVLLLDQIGDFWVAGAGGAVALPESLTGVYDTCNAGYVEATAARSRTFVVSWYRCTASWANNFWSTDGTLAGTRAVALQNSTVARTAPWINGNGGNGNNVLYVSADEEGSASLGISDGTPRGTKRIVELPPGSYPSELLTHDAVALFVLSTDTGDQLWSTDGTAAGTHALSSPYQEIAAPALLGNRAYALASREGVETTLLLVIDLPRLAVEEVVLSPLGAAKAAALTAAAGRLWLTARSLDDAGGAEWSLWASDATAAGTRRLPVVLSSDYWPPAPPLVTALGDVAYFANFDAAHGRELWRSDGTEAGTTSVADLAPGIASGGPQSNVVVWKGRLYFAADDGVHGAELWSTDGTADGTRLALELGRGAAGSSPAGLTIAGDKLFFAASDGVTGRQLWVMDRP
jgi:ELWxxDGT repeat protein